MQLTLSSEYDLTNTIFTNETGQVLYKTSHRFKLNNFRTTTIYKVVPNADPTDMRNRFDVMGEIEWHAVRSTVFRLNGEEMKSKDLLSKRGILGTKRTFKGPDGCPYMWEMLLSVVVLFRDDESKAEVARYHRSSLGIIGPEKKPHLDLSADVLHMLDLVILTFVYMEETRMSGELARNSSASA